MMEITLKVVRMKPADDDSLLCYHIYCLADGDDAEQMAMKETIQMLWNRLSAGKKSFARVEPTVEIIKDFDSSKRILRGRFRLVTTEHDGEMIKVDKSYDNDGNLMRGFGLAPAVKN